MKSTRLAVGMQFVWQGRRQQVVRHLPGQHLSLEDLTTGNITTVPRKDLVAALFKGEVSLTVSSAPSMVAEPSGRELSDYPPHLIERAQWRLALIQPLLGREPVSRKELAHYVAEKRKHFPEETISITSLYRWRSAYVESGGDLRSLVRKDRATGTPLLVPDVEQLIGSVIQSQLLPDTTDPLPQLPSHKAIYHEIVLQVAEHNHAHPTDPPLKNPSLRTVARRIADLDPVARYRSQHGSAAARRKFTQYGKQPSPRAPLEQVEADHTEVDLIVIDENDNLPIGRPTLTTLFDTYSRYPLGTYLGFEPASYYTMKEAMYHAIVPKPDARQVYGTQHTWQAYGLFDTLVVDNAREFIGNDLKDACSILGITLEHAPVRMPEFKAGVERIFRTYNEGLFHQLPGTTFSNVLNRGDYNSEKQAVISLGELQQIFHHYVLDIYAEDYHKGLKAIPARMWEQALQQGFSPRVPTNPDELYIILGRVTQRVLYHYGVEFMNLRYNLVGQNALASLRARLKGEKVKVKYHPEDLSRIYIFDPFEKGYLELPAVDQDYTRGLSLWKHRLLVRAAKQTTGQVDAVALGQARRRLHELVEASRFRRRGQAHPQIVQRKPHQHTSNGVVATPQGADSIAQQQARLNELIQHVSLEGWSTGSKLADLKRDER